MEDVNYSIKENNEKPVADSLTEACKNSEIMQQNNAEILYSESYLQVLNACTVIEKKL